MKKIYYVLILSLCLVSCCGFSDTCEEGPCVGENTSLHYVAVHNKKNGVIRYLEEVEFPFCYDFLPKLLQTDFTIESMNAIREKEKGEERVDGQPFSRNVGFAYAKEKDKFRVGIGYSKSSLRIMRFTNIGTGNNSVFVYWVNTRFEQKDVEKIMLPYIPIKQGDSIVECEYNPFDTKCTKEQDSLVMLEIEALGYPGYRNIAPGDTVSISWHDLVLERNGKTYSWLGWKRDSILKSWAEK